MSYSTMFGGGASSLLNGGTPSAISQVASFNAAINKRE
jgi:hypothetical protein